MMPNTIFISHARTDRDLAEAFIRLLKAALPLTPRDSIRCTSVEGYGLPTGAEVDNQLRSEIVNATAFIALITKNSLKSAYVLFEVGARWGAKRAMFPLMARGMEEQLLEGPLRATSVRMCTSIQELHQFLGEMADALQVGQFAPQMFQSELRVFIDLAAGTPLTITPQETTPSSQLAIPSRGLLGLSPREMCSTLKAAIPLQAEGLAKEYIGHNVDWETTLNSAYPPKKGVVDLHLNPWIPEGYDICIRCATTLEKNPELTNLPKDSKLRLRGKILKVNQFDIDIETTELSVMSEGDIYGTRLCFPVHSVQWELGIEASKLIARETIEQCIKAQVQMGRPEGLQIVENKKLVPEIAPSSSNYKLLVYYAALQIIQTSRVFSDKQRRERIFKLENEIHDLTNGSAFSIWQG